MPKEIEAYIRKFPRDVQRRLKQMPFDQALPLPLVKRIVRARLKAIQAPRKRA